MDLQPGRIVRFLLTDSASGEGVPDGLLLEGQRYDTAKYLESLASAAATIRGPLGYGKNRLRDRLSSACPHTKIQGDK